MLIKHSFQTMGTIIGKLTIFTYSVFLLVSNPVKTIAQRGFLHASLVQDKDALKYISVATGIRGNEKKAANILVYALKDSGMWTGKFYALYPMFGVSPTTCKFNLIDPRDADAAYRLVFTGTPLFNGNGVTWNAVNTYADTKFQFTSGNISSSHLSYYTSTNDQVSGEVVMGALTSTPTTYAEQLCIRRTSDVSFGTLGASTSTAVTNTSSIGWTIITRSSTTDLEQYLNGTNQSTVTTSTTTNVSGFNIFLGGRNSNGTYSSGTDKVCTIATIGVGLTATEITKTYKIFNYINTILSR
jgi:hypothetical protein